MKSIIYLVLLIALVSSCGTTRSAYVNDQDWQEKTHERLSNPVETFVILGDAGKLDGESNGVVDAIKKEVSKLSSTKTLVIVGDNIYPNGLVPESGPYYAEAQAIIDEQCSLLPLMDGGTYIIPGNHDWNDSHPGGRDYVLRQEAYISQYSTPRTKIEWLPRHACGDPEIRVSDAGTVMLFIDSQWWNQKWSEEPNINQDCQIQSRAQFLERINNIYEQYAGQKMLVFLHHPLKTNGAHGGRYSFKEHLFPLTAVNKYLYVPLPVIGSLYPLIRSRGVSRQDLKHVHNNDLAKALKDGADAHKVSATFISGHEHCLEYFEEGNLDFIVSGSGAKVSYAERGHGATYIREARGFALLQTYADGSAWVSFFVVDVEADSYQLDYSGQVW